MPLPPDIPALLAQQPLFQQLAGEALSTLAGTTREKRLPKGEMLFQRGDTPHGFFIVVYGQIKLYLPSADGHEKVIDIVGARQSFGEAVMFMDKNYPVSAAALTDTLLLAIPKAAVFALLDRDGRFARQMLAGLSMRLHALVQDVETYSLHSSTQRVIGYLLQQGSESDAPCRITLPVSKQVIASRLNLTPETFSRILHELSAAALIEVSGRDIMLRDPARLRAHDRC